MLEVITLTTADVLKAEKAKANIKSLLDKVNKETGKEHANLSEGFETLVLGFGAGETEDYDGTIELEGDFEPGELDITDYYEEGKKAGVAELVNADEVKY